MNGGPATIGRQGQGPLRAKCSGGCEVAVQRAAGCVHSRDVGRCSSLNPTRLFGKCTLSIAERLRAQLSTACSLPVAAAAASRALSSSGTNTTLAALASLRASCYSIEVPGVAMAWQPHYHSVA